MLFEKLEEYGCEEVAFFYDKEVGLKSIIVIHDTTLGPAWGGTRFWNYRDEEEAVFDVLRLAKGMTRKASISGLNAGGAKAVIIAKPEQKTEALLRAHGRNVETFKGRFRTGEDVGIGIEDAKIMHKETEYVVGVSKEFGDPSPFTAHGVVCGMKACAKDVYGNSDLSGLKIAIQGVGHVGYNLGKELHQEGSELIVADMKEELTQRVVKECGARVVALEDIYSVDCDIFAPCALGAVINDETIGKLKCRIVAGSANNQLKENRHGIILHEKGIRYAPDYVINAGGLIAIYIEAQQGTVKEAMKEVEGIEEKIDEIIVASKQNNKPTYEIANRLADQRVENKKRDQKASRKA